MGENRGENLIYSPLNHKKITLEIAFSSQFPVSSPPSSRTRILHHYSEQTQDGANAIEWNQEAQVFFLLPFCFSLSRELERKRMNEW